MRFETALPIQSIDMLLERSDTIANIPDSRSPDLQQLHSPLGKNRAGTRRPRQRGDLAKHLSLAESDSLISFADIVDVGNPRSGLTLLGDPSIGCGFWIQPGDIPNLGQLGPGPDLHKRLPYRFLFRLRPPE